MREIKFRAWDKSTKRMSEAEEVTHYFFQGGFLTGIYSDFIFMQYTGLKDKNNVEIYEGDIVQVLRRDWGDYEKDTKRLAVEYYRDAFVLMIGKNKFDDGVDYLPLYRGYGQDRFEVIGNIYKHSHLLDK